MDLDGICTGSTAAPPPPHLPNKQGFRFHKSGSVSPIPPPPSSSTTPSLSSSVQEQRSLHQQQQQMPPLERIPSHPKLISEISSSSSSYSSSSTSVFGGSGGAGAGIGGEAAPSGVDSKLYQIVKRITSCTPSLLISSSSSAGTNRKFHILIAHAHCVFLLLNVELIFDQMHSPISSFREQVIPTILQ